MSAERDLDVLARIRARTEYLSPGAFHDKCDELIRGGLPASSIPQGSPGAEKPLPRLDKYDQWLSGQLSAYSRYLAGALEQLRKAEATQRAVTDHLTPDKAAAALIDGMPGEYRYVCVNCHTAVKRTADNRPRAERCPACFQYRRRNGMDRPRDLWEKAAG